MAAHWFKGLHPAAKTVVVLGCGTAAAAVSFAIWKRVRNSITDEKDEGFVDVSKVCHLHSNVRSAWISCFHNSVYAWLTAQCISF